MKRLGLSYSSEIEFGGSACFIPAKSGKCWAEGDPAESSALHPAHHSAKDTVLKILGSFSL
jgi:hypothetical protein